MSSGMRLGEALQLQVRDFDMTSSPTRINIRPETTKTREQRLAFISKETTNAVIPLLKNKSKNDTIFVIRFTRFTVSGFEGRFSEVRKKCGLTEQYNNGRNFHVNIHSFRAFFHTEATKVVGGDIAHAMIGHHTYLDQYFRLSENEKTDLYKKIEPHVSLSQDYILKEKLQNTEKQLRGEKYYEGINKKIQKQLQEQKDEIDKMSQIIEELQK